MSGRIRDGYSGSPIILHCPRLCAFRASSILGPHPNPCDNEKCFHRFPAVPWVMIGTPGRMTGVEICLVPDLMMQGALLRSSFLHCTRLSFDGKWISVTVVWAKCNVLFCFEVVSAILRVQWRQGVKPSFATNLCFVQSSVNTCSSWECYDLKTQACGHRRCVSSVAFVYISHSLFVCHC